MPRNTLRNFILASMLALPVQAADARWQVLSSDHPLWSQGLEGVALMQGDGSFAMFLLRPDDDDALISVAFPGMPDQPELTSTLSLPDGSVQRLTITGDALRALPAPDESFAAYGFVIAAEDFKLFQAGLSWSLATENGNATFPLTGSSVAIEAAVAQRQTGESGS